MDKHTPGPWVIVSLRGGYKIDPANSMWPTPVVRGVCGAGGVRTKADARLIAAAPELLSALQVIVAEIDNWNNAVESIIGRQPKETWQGLLDARAAIAKATGEAS